MNPMKIMALKGEFEQFQNRHPKLFQFFGAVSNRMMEEGTIMELEITTADGQKLATNIRLSREDVEMFRKFKDIAAE